jgi:ribosome-associated translation inhibitor RaiA
LLREEYKEYFDSEKEKFNSKIKDRDIMMTNYIKEQNLKNKELVEEKKFKICTMEYDSVCGKIDTGIRCIAEPCPSFVEKTFSSKCVMENSEAEILHEGECDISLESKEKKEIEFKSEALIKREKIIQEKSNEIFSKFDSFTEKLESLILKVSEKLKNYDNKDGSIKLLEKINDDLFLSKNKKAEARTIFSKIPQQENKEEVEKNLKEVEKNLLESKNILKEVFINLKKIIVNIK